MAQNNPITVDELTADLQSLNITRLVQKPGSAELRRTSSVLFKTSYAQTDQNTLHVIQRPVALKLVDGTARDQQARREIAVWRLLNHPNVTQFLGIVFLRDGMPPCMVSPFLQENDFLAYIGRHPRSKVGKAREVAAGLGYLHSKNVVHGNIRASNILINNNDVAQINDFSMSRIQGAAGFSTNTQWDPRFNAPELLLGQNISPTFESDIFSLGILFLQIFNAPAGNLQNQLPYNQFALDVRDVDISNEIRKGIRPIRDRYQPMSEAHWNLLCNCWKENPGQRPASAQIVHML